MHEMTIINTDDIQRKDFIFNIKINGLFFFQCNLNRRYHAISYKMTFF